jgi:hypothetical protein
MKFKIFLFILIIVLIILAYFAYPIVKSRYFDSQPEDNTVGTIKNELPNQSKENDDRESSDSNSNDDSENTQAPDITVTSKDCDNECKKFEKDNELEYCQEICGITTYFEDSNDEGGETSECDDANGIQKDYCLKDIAVGNKDFNACEEIRDSNIKKACKNRISEDIMESQQP